MILVPYESRHLNMLENYGNQEDIMRLFLSEVQSHRYEDKGPAFTGLVGDEIVGAAGLIEMTRYRAHAWAILPRQTVTQRFVAIHRAAARFLDEQTYKRIDAQVVVGDLVGHRWAKMLGFRPEVLVRPWAMPDGSAVTEYVRWG